MIFAFVGGTARQQALFTSAVTQFALPCMPNLLEKVNVTWTADPGHAWNGVVTTARDVEGMTATLAIDPTLDANPPPGVNPDRWYQQAVVHGVADLVSDRLFPSEIATLVGILGGSWTGAHPLDDNTRFAAAEILKDLYLPPAVRWNDNRSALKLPRPQLAAFVDAYLPSADLTHANTYTAEEIKQHSGTWDFHVNRSDEGYGPAYARDLTWHWRALACQPGLPAGILRDGESIVYKDFDVGRRSQQLRMEWNFLPVAWNLSSVAGLHGSYPGSLLTRSVVELGYRKRSGLTVVNWPAVFPGPPRNAAASFAGPDEWPAGQGFNSPWTVTPPGGGFVAYGITDYYEDLDPADFSASGFNSPYSAQQTQIISDPSTSFGHALSDSALITMRDRNAWVSGAFVEQPLPPQILTFNFGLRTGAIAGVHARAEALSGAYRFVAPKLGAPYPAWPYVPNSPGAGATVNRPGTATLLFGEGDATSPPSRNARQQPRVLP